MSSDFSAPHLNVWLFLFVCDVTVVTESEQQMFVLLQTVVHEHSNSKCWRKELWNCGWLSVREAGDVYHLYFAGILKSWNSGWRTYGRKEPTYVCFQGLQENWRRSEDWFMVSPVRCSCRLCEQPKLTSLAWANVLLSLFVFLTLYWFWVGAANRSHPRKKKKHLPVTWDTACIRMTDISFRQHHEKVVFRK